MNRVCFHCSPFRWHPNFQSVIITQPRACLIFCVLFPIFRYHNESPTHFDSIIEKALPWVMGHRSSIQWVTWVMGHSKWPIAYPVVHYRLYNYVWETDDTRLSYPKQIANQLRTQYVEGIYRPKYYTVTLKCRLWVTQGHWKRNHWIDHTRLTISRVIW